MTESGRRVRCSVCQQEWNPACPRGRREDTGEVPRTAPLPPAPLPAGGARTTGADAPGSEVRRVLGEPPRPGFPKRDEPARTAAGAASAPAPSAAPVRDPRRPRGAGSPAAPAAWQPRTAPRPPGAGAAPAGPGSPGRPETATPGGSSRPFPGSAPGSAEAPATEGGSAQ